MQIHGKNLLAYSLLLLPSAAVYAQVAPNSLPQGADIVQGNASVSRHDNTLLVDQKSNKAVIEWQNFNIGRDATVRFQQPDVQSAVLNRVTGVDASQILGQLQANGQVVVINPNGVVFGPSARVDVGALVVATLALQDSDFMQDKWRFTAVQKPGQILNQAAISADKIVMVAAKILNHGELTAQEGLVLASGQSVTISTDPSGLLAVDIDAADWQAAITNNGIIDAGDGLVLMKTDVAESFYRAQVSDADNTAQAGVVYRDGNSIQLLSNAGLIKGKSISLDAGEYGHTNISGDISAANDGEIIATGRSVRVAQGARLTANGDNGGRILIGGSWQNSADVRQSLHTLVEAGSVLDASAESDGDGGMIVAWSDVSEVGGLTQVNATLRALGKGSGNRGGQVETSGAQLNVDGIDVSTSDSSAQSGEWLLDPTGIEIVAGSTDTNVDTALSPYLPTGSNSKISVATIQTALESGNNVTIETTEDGVGDIVWEGGAHLNVNLSGDQTLRLNSVDDIYFGHRKPHGNSFLWRGTNISASGGKLNILMNPNRGADGKGGLYMMGIVNTLLGINAKHNIDTNGGDFLVFGGQGFDGYAVGSGVSSDKSAGVLIRQSAISTGEGDIKILGMAADHAGASNNFSHVGILLSENFQLQTTSGNVQLEGSYNRNSTIGATGTGIYMLHNAQAGRVETGSGDIEFSGYGYSRSGTYTWGIGNRGTTATTSFISDSGNIRLFGDAPSENNSNVAIPLALANIGYSFPVIRTSGAEIELIGISHSDNYSGDDLRISGVKFTAADGGNISLRTPNTLKLSSPQLSLNAAQDVNGDGGNVDIVANDFVTYVLKNSFVDCSGSACVSYTGSLDVEGRIRAYYAEDAFFNTYGAQSSRFWSIPRDNPNGPQYNCAYGGLGQDCFTATSLDDPQEMIPGHLAIVREIDANADSINDLTVQQQADLLAANPDLFTLDSENPGQYKTVGEIDLYNEINRHTGALNSGALPLPTLFLQTDNGASLYGDAINPSYTWLDDSGNAVDVNALGITVMGSISYSGLPTAGSNVGDYEYRYGSGLVLRHSNDSYIIRPWQEDAVWRIDPRELSLTGVSTADKIYDGGTGVSISYDANDLSGLLSGEDLVLSHDAGFLDVNAGVDKPVNIEFSLSNGSSGVASNYILADQVLFATISPRDLMINGSIAHDKRYDGNVAAEISAGVLTGLVSGESLLVDVAGVFSSSNAGQSMAVLPEYTLRNDTGLASNYRLANSESLTASIDKKVLMPSFTSPEKIWDGSSAVDVSVDSSAFVLGDDVDLIFDAALLSTDANDQVPVQISNMQLQGVDAGNYQLATTSATFSTRILPAPVTQDFPSGDVQLRFGDTIAIAELISNSPAVVSYRSSDSSVATVDENGLVTVLSAGQAVIYANQAAAGNYAESISSFKIDIAHQDLQMDYDSSPLQKRMGDSDFSLPLTSNSSAQVQWQSSDPSVVRVNADGSLSVTGSGDVSIFAVIPQSHSHTGGEAVFNVSVLAAAGDTPTARIIPQIGSVLNGLSMQNPALDELSAIGVLPASGVDVPELLANDAADSRSPMSLLPVYKMLDQRNRETASSAVLQASVQQDSALDSVDVLQQSESFLLSSADNNAASDVSAGSGVSSIANVATKTILLSTYGAADAHASVIHNVAGSEGFRHIGPISAFSVEPGRRFRAVLPSGFYQHSKSDAKISMSLAGGDGVVLPSWVQFDGEQGMIHGAVPAGITKKVLPMVLTGEDGNGNLFFVEIKIFTRQMLASK